MIVMNTVTKQLLYFNSYSALTVLVDLPNTIGFVVSPWTHNIYMGNKHVVANDAIRARCNSDVASAVTWVIQPKVLHSCCTNKLMLLTTSAHDYLFVDIISCKWPIGSNISTDNSMCDHHP